jgi:hypothetical protein
MLAVVVAFIAPVLVFIFLSIQPPMRLRPDPPAEFFEVRQDWSAKRRAAEDRLARSYWESAGSAPAIEVRVRSQAAR